MTRRKVELGRLGVIAKLSEISRKAYHPSLPGDGQWELHILRSLYPLLVIGNAPALEGIDLYVPAASSSNAYSLQLACVASE
jgi:hypothetical protein